MSTKVLQIIGDLGGHTDYETLKNLPSINDIKLVGNKEPNDLGLQEEMEEYTNLEILEIWNKI